jgi:hypothetical protein
MLEAAAPRRVEPAREAAVAETRLGLTWLNRAGAVVVIAGLALAALWAHEHGYLTPTLRNLLAALVGGVMFAIGAHSLRSGDPARRAFGVGVAAVGAFALYLVPFVATTLDELVPRPAAAAAAGALTLAIGALAAQRREIVLALLAAILGAAYALASDHGVALLPIGALAAGAGLVALAEALFITGALLLGIGAALAVGPVAIPFVGAIGAAGIAELAAPRGWRHALAASMLLVLGVVIVGQRSAFEASFDATQALTLVLALVALRASASGALDPDHAHDRLRLIAYIEAHAIALDLALRAVPWGIATSLVLVAHALALTAIVRRRRLAPGHRGARARAARARGRSARRIVPVQPARASLRAQGLNRALEVGR